MNKKIIVMFTLFILSLSFLGSALAYNPRLDVNGDRIVDKNDLARVVSVFGLHIGENYPNPLLDVNNDGKVDMRDIAMVAHAIIIPISGNVNAFEVLDYSVTWRQDNHYDVIPFTHPEDNYIVYTMNLVVNLYYSGNESLFFTSQMFTVRVIHGENRIVIINTGKNAKCLVGFTLFDYSWNETEGIGQSTYKEIP